MDDADAMANEAGMQIGPVVYTVMTTVAPGWDDEFDQWQRQEHVPNLLSVPGYLSIQGFASLDKAHAYMNVWQIDDRSRFNSEDRALAITTPWKARIAPIRIEQSVEFYQPIDGNGLVAGDLGEEPAPVLTRYDIELRHPLDPSGGELKALIDRLALDPATRYIRLLRNFDAPARLLLLHYLDERPIRVIDKADSALWMDVSAFSAIDRG